MSDTKEHSVMGFPRASGKRRWSGDDELELQSPSKVACTSPRLYSLQTAHPTPAVVPLDQPLECSYMEDSDCEDSTHDLHAKESDEEDNFIDDEEDKDSGFIDGNSIDNSSDEELESKGDSFLSSTSSTKDSCKEAPNLQLSLSKAIDDPCSIGYEEDTLLPPTSCSPPKFSTAITFSGSILEAETASQSIVDMNKGEPSLTTVTATQTGTIVTSAYQGSVPSPTYDLHSYQTSTYTSDLYQPRPCTSTWSCTFYDGSQPTTTNKYMEISPNRSPAIQSIQCDENGKSYLELGSASPYTNTYSNECGSFTTSPSTYHGTSYSQSFPNTPYSPNNSSNSYFNNRHNYSSAPYNYHSGGSESYNGYDVGEGGCSYGYVNGVYVPHPRGSRIQRCSSPSCDPTRTSPKAACYQQQRLSVLNMSMFKLNRFSRFPEPSLHRSVLICNTLKHIEKEMEGEGVSMTALLAQSHNYGQGAVPVSATPETFPSMPSSSAGPLPSLHSPPLVSPSTVSSTPFELSYPVVTSVTDHSLTLEQRTTFSPAPNRASLVSPSEPMEEEVATSSSISQTSRVSVSEDRCSSDGGINWCSVLSLSSQTDLDSMNNNECNEWNNETITRRCSDLSSSSNSEEGSVPAWKLPSLSADDVLKTFPDALPKRQEEELDSIMKVLVGS